MTEMQSEDDVIVSAMIQSGTPIRMRKAAVANLLGCSTKHLERMVNEELFPRPERDGKIAYWWSSDVDEQLKKMHQEDKGQAA